MRTELRGKDFNQISYKTADFCKVFIYHIPTLYF